MIYSSITMAIVCTSNVELHKIFNMQGMYVLHCCILDLLQALTCLYMYKYNFILQN